jgi:starch synthase
MFEPKFVSEMDFDNGATPIPHFFDPDIAKLNGMRRGIRYADVINTVSPTYAKEILTEEFGEGLDKILNERKSRLFGILNGIDTQQLNPKTDKELAINYSIETVEKRKDNKIVLQKQFGLPSDKDKFIMGMVSRIDGQKGFDLVTQILEPLLENIDFQFIIIGEGDSGYKAYFEEMKKKYPDKIGIHLSFDSRLPRIFFGGADVVLIPSRFEPSGLVQMEAMRYGCIPIVRKVGGLADSVTDVNLKKSTGTGFVFKDYNPFAFMIAIIRAYELYNQEKEWIKLIKRAMKEDFSWEKSAKEYLKLFEMAFRLHKEDKK